MTIGRLQNQVAIVTGGAGGIGAATCRQIAAAGAIVVVTDISDTAGEAVAGGIRAAGQLAVYQRLDVTEEGSWRALRTRVLSDFGVPSVLVNNAGIDVVRNTFDTTPEQWERIFAVNMKGIYLGVRTFAKDMHEAAVRDNRHSSVVNMSSICGLIGVAFQTAYCASKGAVRLYTKALALEFAALGLKVRVNSIHPGTVDTAFAAQCLKELGEVGFAPSPAEARAAIARAHPIGHMAEPDEIADAIVFLASNESRFMTGSELVVDGGYTAQ